jgi:hypothetical protein
MDENFRDFSLENREIPGLVRTHAGIAVICITHSDHVLIFTSLQGGLKGSFRIGPYNRHRAGLYEVYGKYTIKRYTAGHGLRKKTGSREFL